MEIKDDTPLFCQLEMHIRSPVFVPHTPWSNSARLMVAKSYPTFPERLVHVISTMRPDIDHVNECFQSAAAHSLGGSLRALWNRVI